MVSEMMVVKVSVRVRVRVRVKVRVDVPGLKECLPMGTVFLLLVLFALVPALVYTNMLSRPVLVSPKIQTKKSSWETS